MTTTFSDIYESLFSDTLKNFEYISKELLILQVFEDSIDKLITDKIKNLNKGRGTVFISRFNARGLRQDAFYVHFNPAEEDRMGYVQSVIAEGYILEKKIIFRTSSHFPQYVHEYYFDCLKDIFRDFGFKIEYQNY